MSDKTAPRPVIQHVIERFGKLPRDGPQDPPRDPVPPTFADPEADTTGVRRIRVGIRAPIDGGTGGVVVINPPGTPLEVDFPAAGGDVNVHDGSGNAITSTLVGSVRGIDVAIASPLGGATAVSARLSAVASIQGSILGVPTLVTAETAGGTTAIHVRSVSSSGGTPESNVNVRDGSGNSTTSTGVGAVRGLDVGIADLNGGRVGSTDIGGTRGINVNVVNNIPGPTAPSHVIADRSASREAAVLRSTDSFPTPYDFLVVDTAHRGRLRHEDVSVSRYVSVLDNRDDVAASSDNPLLAIAVPFRRASSLATVNATASGNTGILTGLGGTVYRIRKIVLALDVGAANVLVAFRFAAAGALRFHVSLRDLVVGYCTLDFPADAIYAGGSGEGFFVNLSAASSVYVTVLYDIVATA